MSLKEQMQTGKVYVEFGHSSEEDKAYEIETENQRQLAKDLCFDYNNTRPTDLERKGELLGKLLGSHGSHIWMEAPIHFAYGSNTHMGSHVYANFNLTVVDDGECHIGSYVMFAPNVVISTTGHPLHPSFRDKGAQFSLPVVIKDHVWIGSNVTIMPGVTIGENSVIGAGSVVTKDIPDNVVACGVPCRVMREITDEDKIYYRPGMKINEDWDK
ncbi:MAG: sugar O-acetyltransferase [Clostridia bacterium]|nr:sugar O-acetyltransferase [Clostridia bacterium]